MTADPNAMREAFGDRGFAESDRGLGGTDQAPAPLPRMIDPAAVRLARIFECIGGRRPHGVEDLRLDDQAIALEAVSKVAGLHARGPEGRPDCDPWHLARAVAALRFVRAIDAAHRLEPICPVCSRDWMRCTCRAEARRRELDSPL